MLGRSQSAWGRYGAAVAAIGVATAARYGLGVYTEHSYPFAMIFLAVVFSAWYGGFGPAILAAALGFGSMFVLPDNRPAVGSAVLGILFYVAFSVGIAALGGMMARARQRIADQIDVLTRQQRALEEAAQRKDEFLAVLAHELRNPLAPIASALDILKQPRLDPAIAAKARDTADRQLQHMTRLVDDLLDVSRIMRGKVELRKERVELAGVVERAVETVRPLIDRERQQLTIELPETPVWIEADLVRLAQVLANLLGNAAKYSELGGQIHLSATVQEGEVAVCVRDSGIGIDPEILPRLFEMFMQAVPGSGRSRGGLGIGLTLVKNLVELHGGVITAHSEGLGQGSEFMVRLPHSELPAEAPQPTPVPREEGPRRKILVVDDNVDAAQSLAMLLRLRGHQVQAAFGGAEALEAATADEPELVFLDIGMPGMDGYVVARRLRAGFPASMMLVALTGWGTEQDRQRSREAGFDHHLTKPVDLAALEAVLAAGVTDPLPKDELQVTNT